MKLFLIASLLFVSTLTACESTDKNNVPNDQILIEGSIKEPVSSIVSVQHYKRQLPIKLTEIKTIELSPDNTFKAYIDWPEAGHLTLMHGHKELQLFMEPGQHLKISSSGPEFSTRLNLQGTARKQNAFLIEHKNMIRQLSSQIQQNHFTEEPETFTKVTDSLYKHFYDKMNEHFESAETAFTKDFHNHLKYSFGNMLFRYGSYQKQEGWHEIPESFYAFIDTIPVNPDNSPANPVFANYLDSYLNYEMRKQDEMQFFESVAEHRAFRVDFAGHALEGPAKEIMQLREIHKLQEEGHSDKAEELIRKLEEEGISSENIQVLKNNNTNSNTSAPNFQYPDTNGDTVALEDFQGQVVYLDVWASWCTPCLREFPHTSRLYEEFQDENVIFLYVSIDRDREDWLAALEKHDLSGVNLYAGNHFDAQIVQDYRVSSIPRYIIIDKDGNIADINAPRPSGDADEAIKKHL